MLLAAIGQYFFGIAIFLSSTFLILLVLVQRGRGGGLTGALGGAGGQSAFGTKAGDVFTKITVGVAAAWIFLCGAAVFALKSRAFSTGVEKSANSISAPDDGAGIESPTGTDPLEGLPEMPTSGTTTEAEVTEMESDDSATGTSEDGDGQEPTEPSNEGNAEGSEDDPTEEPPAGQGN